MEKSEDWEQLGGISNYRVMKPSRFLHDHQATFLLYLLF